MTAPLAGSPIDDAAASAGGVRGRQGVGGAAGTVIRPALPADAEAWGTLRTALWPHGSAEDHAIDIARFFWSGDDASACLVAEGAQGIVGFAELSIRGYAEGCETDRVAYLEGWYVVPAWQRTGIGRALVAAGEGWARARGFREFASDTTLDNAGSQAAHAALGFREVERIVCYHKTLDGRHA